MTINKNTNKSMHSIINIVLYNVFTPTRKALDFKHVSQ